MNEQQRARAYDPTTLAGEPEEPGTLRDEEGNILPSFDARYAEPFLGLLYVGALADEFTWLGHNFVIRTLRDGEKLAVAMVIKEYADTMAADRAYAAALVAICTMSVDGNDLPIPIGEMRRAYEWCKQRFDYVIENWYSSTIDMVYNRYTALEFLAARVIDALGKASAPEDSNPSSSAI